MSKVRWLVFVFVLCASFGSLKAQVNTQISQYMEIPTAFNPAAVGDEGMMSVFGLYRLQWAGFDDAPNDVFFSVTMPFKAGHTRHGAGLIFSSDEIGLFKNQSVLLQYSYKVKLFNGELGLGLNVGFVNQTFDKDEVDFSGGNGEMMEGDEFHESSDPFVDTFTKEGYQDVVFDVSAGCLFRNEDFYAGFSVLHLNSGTVDLGSDKYKMYVPRTFLLNGGYEWKMPNPVYMMKPSFLLKTDFVSWQAEVSALLEYNKRIRGGLSYRFGDAFVFLFGVDVINGLHVGYSYDLPTSKLIKSGGSHEVFLRYNFKPQFNRKNKYKSERIL